MNILYICLGIFFARILDVSIGVVRTIVMVRGGTIKVAFLAFFEVFIWYLAAREALNVNINSIWIPLSYSGGYATGTYIGTILSKYLIKGTTTVQIITSQATPQNLQKIRNSGYGISIIPVKNAFDGQKKDMLIIETSNQKLSSLLSTIQKIDHHAFITTSETKYVSNGYLK